MDPIARAMFMGSAAAGGFDPNTPIGTSIEGGFFAGLISHTANGVATHALIVAPNSTGLITSERNNSSLTGANSVYDGAYNTALISSTSAVASFCAGLSIGGYTDWYLPANAEYEIAYYNLKPTTDSNSTSYGTNAYAVPARASNYTTGNPAQTSVSAFQSGGSEAFSGEFHCSTEFDSSNCYRFGFTDGQNGTVAKASRENARAFRKVAL